MDRAKDLLQIELQIKEVQEKLEVLHQLKEEILNCGNPPDYCGYVLENCK